MDIDYTIFARELIKIINTQIKEQMKASNLSDVMYATYTGNGLKVDDKPIEVEMDMVEVPEHLKKYKVKVSFDLTKEELDNRVLIVKKSGEKVELSRLKFDKIPIEIEYDKMEAGQKYLVQQKKGSQTYVILDRIPEETA